MEIHLNPFGRFFGASNFLLRFRYLLGGLVSMGCLLGSRFALEVSPPILNVPFVERILKIFIMRCFIVTMLSEFGAVGLICLLRSLEIAGPSRIRLCISLLISLPMI